MNRRDLRLRLVGHLLEHGGKQVTRDLNRTIRCEQCHGHLDIGTNAITGEVVEECPRCGRTQVVPRFLPAEEEE
jgi:hypothetical protein